MSRSYKKNPITKDGRSGVVGKTFANRRVRRLKISISNGKSYRMYFNPYNVHDYISRYTWEDQKAYNESEELAYLNGATEERLWYFSRPKDYNSWARMIIRK